MVYEGLGDTDSTMLWLQKAYDQPETFGTLPNCTSWREFRLVQNDPRFIALMKKVGVM